MAPYYLGGLDYRGSCEFGGSILGSPIFVDPSMCCDGPELSVGAFVWAQELYVKVVPKYTSLVAP